MLNSIVIPKLFHTLLNLMLGAVLIAEVIQPRPLHAADRVSAATPPARAAIQSALAFSRAMAASENKDWDQALRQAEAALKGDPEHAAARMQAAYACWHLEQYEKAAALYGTVKGPLAANARLWQANSLAAAGDWTGAMKAYGQRLADDFPAFWAPFSAPTTGAADNTQRGIIYWKRLSKANPNTALPQWLLGNTYAAANRWGEAITAYKSALLLEPQWEPALISMAMVRHKNGETEIALQMLDELLRKQPKHIGALFVRAEIQNAPKSEIQPELWIVFRKEMLEMLKTNALAASANYDALIKVLGRRVNSATLVSGARTAWLAGNQARGVEYLNKTILWATEADRVLMMESDQDTLNAFVNGSVPGDMNSCITRYAFAGALYGEVQTALGAIQNNGLLAIGSCGAVLRKVNVPTQADLAFYERHARQVLESSPGIGNGMVVGMAAGVYAHLGRSIRELELAIKECPSFVAARVLLAQIHWERDERTEAIALLKEVLAAHPEATSIRLRLSRWSPLDEAQELLDAIPSVDAGRLNVMRRQATYKKETGDIKGCLADALAFQRLHGAHWDMFELLGVSLGSSGDSQSALECLEYSVTVNYSVQGMLTLATLRDKLGKPGVIEALIDAWRAADRGSEEEVQSAALLRQRDSKQYICKRCGGGGTTAEPSGFISSGTGSISSEEVVCPLCLGLGLWHPKAR